MINHWFPSQGILQNFLREIALELIKTTQRIKIVENYIWFPVVHSFDVEKFESLDPVEFVLMTCSVYKIFLNSKWAISKQSCQN